MVAHVELPALDPAKVPSTFSQPTIDGLLRHDLGFDGLVYTDSMSMAAITAMTSPGEAAARAVEAGADLVAAFARRRGGSGGDKDRIRSRRDHDGAHRRVGPPHADGEGARCGWTNRASSTSSAWRPASAGAHIRPSHARSASGR